MKYTAHCENYEIISWPSSDAVEVDLGDLNQVKRNTRGKCLESVGAGGRCIYNCDDIIVHGIANVTGSPEHGDSISFSVGQCDSEGFPIIPIRNIVARGVKEIED